MKYEWTKMSPRERDALVAEKVMEWSSVSIDVDSDYYGYPSGVDRGLGCYKVAAYTTDIAAAREVVEKVQDIRVLSFELGRMYDLAEMKWFAKFSDHYGLYHGADSYSAPEAICMAALLAMGVDVE